MLATPGWLPFTWGGHGSYDTYITGPEFTVLTIHGLDRGRGSFLILNAPGLYSCSQGHEDAPGRAAYL